MPFQQRYASLILELERINRDLNEYLIGVQHCCHEVFHTLMMSVFLVNKHHIIIIIIIIIFYGLYYHEYSRSLGARVPFFARSVKSVESYVLGVVLSRSYCQCSCGTFDMCAVC